MGSVHGASLARRVVVPAVRAFAVCFPLTLIVALSSPRADVVLHTGAPDTGQGGSQGGWSSSSDLPVLGLGPLSGDPRAGEVPNGVVAAVQPAAGTGSGTGGSFTSQGAAAPFGITSVTTLTSSGIPTRAYQAYLRAQSLMARDRVSCKIQWSLVAGIGRVESNHGRFGGAGFAADGRVVPPILGVLLDGHLPGTAVIRDSDHGAYDGSASYDRAVGPMQFLPQTWNSYGGDANGDGRRDPQQIDDAAYGAARYLCAGGGDLSTFAGAYAAVYRYNHSDSYVRLVLSLAQSYATGQASTVPDTVPSGGHSGSGGGSGAGPGGTPPGIGGDGGNSGPGGPSGSPTTSPSPTGSSPSPTTSSPSPTTSSPSPTTSSPTPTHTTPTGTPTTVPPSPTTTTPTPTDSGTVTPTTVTPTPTDTCLVTPNPTDPTVTPTVPPGCPTPTVTPSVTAPAVVDTVGSASPTPSTATAT